MNETNYTAINNTVTTNSWWNETLYILDSLHFVRPEWLFAFIPLVIYLYLFSTKTKNSKNWQSVIDERLLPFVLTKGSQNKRRLYPLFLIFLAGTLCITALAGPVYKKLPQPVYREQSAVVILLDLSASMNAGDIKPSRLSRAKLKLLDILKARKTGQTALIAYAADSFVVTPLTDDNATIANLVPALDTKMMPAQGSNLSSALAKTFSLFNQSGVIKGNILVITDGIHEKDEPAIEKVSLQGHHLSILGVGTTVGGPIPLIDSTSGGFLLDKQGGIVIPKLEPQKLQRFALTGGGVYTELRANDDDVNRLTRLFESKDIAKSRQQKNNDEHSNDNSDSMWADSWREEGHWLLLPLLFLVALWSRKGWIAALLPFSLTLLIGIPQPAHADKNNNESLSTTVNELPKNEEPLIDTDNFWSTNNQKAMRAFNEGDNTKAATHFTQPEWKASALYKNGDYEAAAELFDKTKTSDGYYNKANALAKQGKYPEAIKAYDNALELNQNNEDAKYNREQVKKALEKQKEQQQQEQQQDNQQQNSEQNSDENQNKDNQNNDQQSSDQQNNDQQQSDQQQSDNNSESSEQENQQSPEQQTQDQQTEQQPEQQQSEEQELKQRDAEKEKQDQEAEQKRYDEQQEQDKQQQEQHQEQQSNSVEHKESDDKENEKQQEIEINPTEASITEEEKATEQWLKRIPDDPGGLLRRKFLYQYSRTPNQADSDEPW